MELAPWRRKSVIQARELTVKKVTMDSGAGGGNFGARSAPLIRTLEPLPDRMSHEPG